MAYVGTPIDTTNQFQSLVGKRFSGDASTTAFTLDVAPSSTLDIEVFVENVRQDPNSAYSLSGTTLTFAAAPPSGTNNIYVVHQAKAVGTISPAAGTVNADSFDNTVISGHTALAAIPATTDELLISDAGTIKRIDAQFFQNTPAFFAYLSGDQNISNNTATKASFDTEDFDTDSMYDASTNYRFTPTVAGKYFVYACLTISASAYVAYATQLNIRKNGSDYIVDRASTANDALYELTMHGSGVIDFNGSSDYVEVFGLSERHSGSAQQKFVAANRRSHFGAFKIIGA
jgi:hypothetical protein